MHFYVMKAIIITIISYYLEILINYVKNFKQKQNKFNMK